MGLLRYIGTSVILKSLGKSGQTYSSTKTSGEAYPFDVFDLPVYGSGAGLVIKGTRYAIKRFSKWYLKQSRMHPYRTGAGTGIVASTFYPRSKSAPRTAPKTYSRFPERTSSRYNRYRKPYYRKRYTCTCKYKRRPNWMYRTRYFS